MKKPYHSIARISRKEPRREEKGILPDSAENRASQGSAKKL